MKYYNNRENNGMSVQKRCSNIFNFIRPEDISKVSVKVQIDLTDISVMKPEVLKKRFNSLVLLLHDHCWISSVAADNAEKQ